MGAGRPLVSLKLEDGEPEQLQVWARRRKTAQGLALRSRIILSCAEGCANKAVAMQLSITNQTVSKWRGRFLKLRLDGLLDTPRSGAPRTIDDARVDAVIAKTLETQPMNATHWSTRMMAKEAKLSQTFVCEFLTQDTSVASGFNCSQVAETAVYPKALAAVPIQQSSAHRDGPD